MGMCVGRVRRREGDKVSGRDVGTWFTLVFPFYHFWDSRFTLFCCSFFACCFTLAALLPRPFPLALALVYLSPFPPFSCDSSTIFLSTEREREENSSPLFAGPQLFLPLSICSPSLWLSAILKHGFGVLSPSELFF